MSSDATSTPTARADAFILFGLTGDLGEKKLFPALYELAAAGMLDMPVVGVGRTDYGDADLRDMFVAALTDFEPADGSTVDDDVVKAVDLTYVSGDSTEQATFDALADRLGHCRLPLVYAALPPAIFGSVASGIAGSALPDDTRLVVEKPFGDDVSSAQSLYAEITDALSDEQLFIVDHFLAKAAIENMSVVRHSNALIDNSLRTGSVESIDVVMSEAGGVDGRGSFYESVGAIDDVVQNHLLQTLAMVTMDAPAESGDRAFHEARAELLGRIPPVDPGNVTIGQYRGYRDHDDVDDDSTVETFVRMQLSIDDERWAGVPITISTGKHLSESATSVTFTLVDTAPGFDSIPNRVRFTVKPQPSVSLELGVLDPDSHAPVLTTLYAWGPFDHGDLGDYATMFANAMAGDRRHFAQIDGIVAAWRIVAPITDADLDLVFYEPGTPVDQVTSQSTR